MSSSASSEPPVSMTDSTMELPSTFLKRRRFPRISDKPLTELVDVENRYNLFSLSPDVWMPESRFAISPVQTMLSRFLKDEAFTTNAILKAPVAAGAITGPTSISSGSTADLPASYPQVHAPAPRSAPVITKSMPYSDFAHPMNCAATLALVDSSALNEARDTAIEAESRIEIKVNDMAISLPGTPISVKGSDLNAEASSLPIKVDEPRKSAFVQTEPPAAKVRPALPTIPASEFQSASRPYLSSALPWFPVKPDVHTNTGIRMIGRNLTDKEANNSSPPPAPMHASSFDRPLPRQSLPQLQTNFGSADIHTAQPFLLGTARGSIRNKPAPINPHLVPLRRSATWDYADEPKTAFPPKAPSAAYFQERSIKPIRQVRFSLPDDDFAMSPLVSPFAESIPDTPSSMISSDSTESLGSFSLPSPDTPTQNHHFVTIFSEPFENELVTPIEDQMTPIEDEMKTPVAEEQYTRIAAILASFDTGRGRSAARELVKQRTARSLSPRGSPKQYVPEPPKRHGTLLAKATIPRSKFDIYGVQHGQMTCKEIKANTECIGKNVVLESFLGGLAS